MKSSLDNIKQKYLNKINFHFFTERTKLIMFGQIEKNRKENIKEIVNI